MGALIQSGVLEMSTECCPNTVTERLPFIGVPLYQYLLVIAQFSHVEDGLHLGGGAKIFSMWKQSN